FTIDVAESIGSAATPAEVDAFLGRHPELVGTVVIPGIGSPLALPRETVTRVAGHYLRAAREAGVIYRHIAAARGGRPFAVEVSMDETESPQTPPELLLILAMLADEGIPLQTIAPKFTGRFNKGVDYVGDLAQFEREFAADVAGLAYAAGRFALPAELKLSVHSGSDKFSLYPIIRRVLAATGAGVHLKTAGTTWLEELIGLAESGGDGLDLAREIYAYALDHVDELCGPYASVIDIDTFALPSAEVVNGWSGPRFAAAIRHVPGTPEFDPNIRQLLHVSFKVAARQGSRYTDLLRANRDVVGHHVAENLYKRHLRPLFVGDR
ncbi:MAG: tagaturonate epimerase family protein, partial [Planctomycetia bacterium]